MGNIIAKLGKPNILIVLGNGFTIDFLRHYAAVIDPNIDRKIDVINLFRLGDRINSPWDGKPGLLSYRNFPSLWTLGARPQNTVEESTSLISEIITCANMYFGSLGSVKNSTDNSSDNSTDNSTDNGADNGSDNDASIDKIEFSPEYMHKIEIGKETIYLRAYSELVVYLRCLFSHYNSCISDEALQKFVSKEKQWGWLELFEEIKHRKNPDEVFAITYNYDIWLERILKSLDVPFIVQPFLSDEQDYYGIEIYKPHGSINFASKESKDCSIVVDYDITEKFGIDVEQIECQGFTSEKYNQGLIIPPLGDSSRFVNVAPWSLKMKEEIINRVVYQLGRNRHAPAYADVILCGISYGYADRKEIDELLTSLYYDVDITQINPNPSKELNAILTSLFRKYVYQTDSCRMKDILRR